MAFHTTYSVVFENHVRHIKQAQCFGELKFIIAEAEWGKLTKLVYHLLPTSPVPNHILNEYNEWVMTAGSHIANNKDVESLYNGVEFSGITPYLRFLFMASCLRLPVEQPATALSWYELYTMLLQRGIHTVLAGAKALSMCEVTIPSKHRVLRDLYIANKIGIPRGYIGHGTGFWRKNGFRYVGAHSPTPMTLPVTAQSILDTFYVDSPTIHEVVVNRTSSGFFSESLEILDSDFYSSVPMVAANGAFYLPINDELVNLVAEVV